METLFYLFLWNNLDDWIFFSYFYCLLIYFFPKDSLSLLCTFQGAAFVFLVDFREVFIYGKILPFVISCEYIPELI